MQKDLKKSIQEDCYRNLAGRKISIISYLFDPNLKYLKCFRCAQYYRERPILWKYYKIRLAFLNRRYFIQIPWNTTIGKGFYIGHFGRVIINSDVVIGDNVNVATGITIGQTSRGSRQGCPTIGNRVWIGTNAVIVGKITIGDDVLIAANSYVNIDVPSHSIVIGNPAKIIPRENATENYVNYIV